MTKASPSPKSPGKASGSGTGPFSAIADPTRRALLDMLLEGEQPVASLVDRVDVTFGAVSQHLKILREAGLVERRAEGRQRIYSARAARLAEVDVWVAQYRRFWSEKLDSLGDYLDETS